VFQVKVAVEPVLVTEILEITGGAEVVVNVELDDVV
jgi:hypothetical protein